MKNSTEVKCKLNYSFLLDEVLFINANGEKMALAKPEDISEVHIANRYLFRIKRLLRSHRKRRSLSYL